MTPTEGSAMERANRDPSPALKTGITVKPGAPTKKPAHDAGANAPAPPRPMPLPWTDTNAATQYASDPAPAVYYEGESCSGSGGYYDDGYSDDSCSGSSGSSDDTVYVGGDTYAGDDDDDDTSSSSGDDDDDDDVDNDVDIEWGDDDDDSIELAPRHELMKKPISKPLTLSRPPPRKQSPVSRLALLGVLIAFPLRRRFRSGA